MTHSSLEASNVLPSTHELILKQVTPCNTEQAFHALRKGDVYQCAASTSEHVYQVAASDQRGEGANEASTHGFRPPPRMHRVFRWDAGMWVPETDVREATWPVLVIGRGSYE